MEPDKDTQGIYVRSQKTFYYYVTGAGQNPNAMYRLKSALLAKGLLSYVRENPRDTTPLYKVMTYADALDKGVDVQPIYVNDHVRKLHEGDAEVKKPGGGWG